jgi:dihydrofolate reductase
VAAKLLYSTIASLDGYVADEDGNFDWGEPDEEVHSFVNDLQRQVGTHLYGRRMYEVMVAWEDTESFADQPSYMRDFAEIWQAADECHLFVAQIVVGGGKRFLPDHVRVELELLGERRFGNGMVHLHYRTRR